jgi:hypothetical protein
MIRGLSQPCYARQCPPKTTSVIKIIILLVYPQTERGRSPLFFYGQKLDAI